MYKRVLLKLSGEALSTDKPLDSKKLHNLAKEIKSLQDEGVKIGIVCGGGNVLRGRLADELGLDRVQVDYIGMLGTLINCLALKAALDAIGAKAIVQSALDAPQVCESLNPEVFNKYLEDGMIVLFGSGTGKPYCSTDTAAAMRAEEMNADVILIAKNGVDGVYSADPNKDASAVKYDILTYKELEDKKLEVIDLQASSICQRSNIESFVFSMNEDGNIRKAALQTITGTRIVVKED